MITIRYGNFFVQSVLIIAAMILAIGIIFNQAYVSIFFVVQLCLGMWQYLGCILTNAKAKSRKAKRYFQFSSVYIVLLLPGPYMLEVFPTDMRSTISTLFILVPPWVLAVYYYLIIAKAT